MPQDRSIPHSTLALSTKVEEDFVAPLTAVRGSLEILRDFPELTDDERKKFIGTALRSCSKLEGAVRELATTVYAASEPERWQDTSAGGAREANPYKARLHVLSDIGVIEVDFSAFEFSSSKIVNEFYDAIEELFEAADTGFYVLVNFRNCSIWPEAWVAFAHRGKRLNVNYSLGTVRYAEAQDNSGEEGQGSGSDQSNADQLVSRATALAEIEEMKRARAN